MGYRYRIGILPKSESLRELTPLGVNKELVARRADGLYEVFNEVFDLGDWHRMDEILSELPKYFLEKDTQDAYDHYDAHIATAQTILRIMQLMRRDIAKHYASLLADSDEAVVAFKTKQEIDHHMRVWQTAAEFDADTPVVFDKNDPRVANSVTWEYEIFELARIYKTLDFENNEVVIYGW